MGTRGKRAGLALEPGSEKGELLHLVGLGASGTMAGWEGFAQCCREACAGTARGAGLLGGRAGQEALAGAGELRQACQRPNDKPKQDF